MAANESQIKSCMSKSIKLSGADLKLTLTERFDYGALSFIINNFSSFNFRPETDAKETLSMIRRYKAYSSPDGTLCDTV